MNQQCSKEHNFDNSNEKMGQNVVVFFVLFELKSNQNNYPGITEDFMATKKCQGRMVLIGTA